MEDISKQAARKKEQQENEFEDLQETIINGVVGTYGLGAGKMPSDKYWSLSFSLVAWREIGYEINHSKLILSKNLIDGELKVIQAKIKEESLVKLKVKLSKKSTFGYARAQLVSILDTPDDIELKAVLTKYKEPVEINHPEFGTLVLDRSVDWFEGEVSWINKPIRISVSLDEETDSPESGLATIESLYKDASNWSKKITDYAVSQLLELKNENWLSEGEQKLDAAAFINSMKLESITVYPDGEFEFWHNDGDLFWGHSILISGTLTEGPNYAEIPG
ncbi:MAG: DUF2262 domain-containing protein [Saccharospirillaceae bacterium]|nr:DUF2262 domain-containing protein [Pseudomonadales bacterium]NRB78709.1 DUF2262 domain-containing protein [Saccharospirillaceae bacterium]